jgi:mannose-6-phosphate isomerase-like protein (cupin superfamily)
MTFDAEFFNLTTPLLAQGRVDNLVAQTELLKLVVKVYAAGGENAMHQHPYEDHAFVVLQGEATFHINADENIHVVKKNDGVMLKRGVCYWFQSSSAENLVMLRVGAAEKWPADGRAFPDGRQFAGDSVENKEIDVVPLAGRQFSL